MDKHVSSKQIGFGQLKRIHFFLFILILSARLTKLAEQSSYKCWEIHRGRLYEGLSLTDSIATLPECLEFCQSELQNCRIVSFAARGLEHCFASNIYKVVLRDMAWRGHFDTFILDRGCLAGKCWSHASAKKHKGLIHDYEVSLERCVEKCTYEVANCKAIAYYNGNSWPCYHDPGNLDALTQEDAVGIDSYTLDRSCLGEVKPLTYKCFELRQNVRYIGLTNTYKRSKKDCIQQCIDQGKGCRVMNYAYDTKWPCWTAYTNVIDESKYENYSGVDTHVLDRACLAGKCWEYVLGTKYSVLTNNNEQTFERCIENCQNELPNCILINYASNDKWPCWSSSKQLSELTHELKAGTDTYKLDRSCLGDTPVVAYKCWDKRPDKKFPGLSNNYKLNLKDCIENCEKETYGCRVIYFVAGERWPCWTSYTNVLDETKLENQTGADAYILDRSCYAGECWAFYLGRKYDRLINNYEPTLERCLKNCQDEVPHCTVISFINNNRRPCWHATGYVDFSVFTEVAGTDSYIVDRTCLGRGSAPARTTTKTKDDRVTRETEHGPPDSETEEGPTEIDEDSEYGPENVTGNDTTVDKGISAAFPTRGIPTLYCCISVVLLARHLLHAHIASPGRWGQ